MIDTHAHLNLSPLIEDVPQVMVRAREVGVSKAVVPGCSLETSQNAVRLAAMYPEAYAAVGIHPSEARDYVQSGTQRAEFQQILTTKDRFVAVGEVGLEYYYMPQDATPDLIAEEKGIQRLVFGEMIDAAKQLEKPLIIHTREAFVDTYAILREKAAGHPTVIHCFTGSLEEARSWVDMGCMISFTGILTYKKNDALRAVAKELPLEQIMIETDAPYLSPEGFRREVCEPRHVMEVARCLAQIKDMSVEAIDERTTQTAIQFFGLYE